MIRFVKKETTQLFADAAGTGLRTELIWGDRVEVLDETPNGDGLINVRARAARGWVRPSHLGNKPLLELYFIDVGQGDGVLIRTPDGRHLLVDGGYKRSRQPTGKNAADFVDWKFAKEYQEDVIALDALIASHNDADHYGGLWDLINPNETAELDCPRWSVNSFFHAGVSWYSIAGNRTLGRSEGGYLLDLLGERASLLAGLDPGSGAPQFQGEWRQFLGCVRDLDCHVERLSQRSRHVPGYGPDSDVAIRVLGPVEFDRGGVPAVKDLGSPSQNTNGNSLLLRVDYGRVRVLLTGDLNAASQRVLLEHYTGSRQELACDVAKGCHHGSDDVSYEFLQTLGASATIISSGDNEAHAHPRPSVVAASALTGHRKIEDDKVLTPLVYSTEISRSLRLGRVDKITADEYPAPGGPVDVELTAERRASVHFREQAAGDLQPRAGTKSLNGLYVVAGVIYGLVNVRTDGNKILCATLNEKSNTFDVKTFYSRF